MTNPRKRHGRHRLEKEASKTNNHISRPVLYATTATLAVTGVLQIANAIPSSAMPRPLGGKTTVKRGDGRIYYDLAGLNPHTQAVFRDAIRIWNEKLVGQGRGLLGVWDDLTPAEKEKLGGRAQIQGAYENWTNGNPRNGTLGQAGPDVDLLKLDAASFDDGQIKRYWDGHYGPRFNWYPMVKGLGANGLPEWRMVRNFDEWREDVWKGNENTILHEMGHTLGLHHPQRPVRPGEVMRTGDLHFPQVGVGGADWPDSLEPDPAEVNFVRNLYRSEIGNLHGQDGKRPADDGKRPTNGRRPGDPNLPRSSSDWKQGWDPATQSWVPYADWNAKYGSKPYLSADGWYVHDPKTGWVRSDTWKRESASVGDQQSHKDVEPASQARKQGEGQQGDPSSHLREEQAKPDDRRQNEQRTDQQRQDERRADEQRAEKQRAKEQRADGQRQDEQRAENQRAYEQRQDEPGADGQRADKRRVVDQRADQQRQDERRADEQRAEDQRQREEERR
ncbi:hypothetical protein ACFV2N_45820 [Streptomyces sp. NPDC059680]|uniref:hypothetical protein n=1 Tax=Streptomyces sp. NPDC059680 TaxID=3346904 RepID=UPI003695602C